MNDKRPYIVTFIGDVSIFSAIISIIASVLSLINIFGVYEESVLVFFIETLGLLLPIVLLIASLGYMRLKKWGYWLLLFCNIGFLILSVISSMQSQQQSASISIIWTVISLVFIIPTRKYFD